MDIMPKQMKRKIEIKYKKDEMVWIKVWSSSKEIKKNTKYLFALGLETIKTVDQYIIKTEV